MNKVERLKSWSQGNNEGPYRVEIHPTNRCNLKCRMCGTRASWKEEGENLEKIMNENKEREISDKRLLDLIKESNDLGVERILLTGGGEPLIRKDVTLKMMKGIKENGIFGNINTNGILWEEEDIRKLVNIKWDLVMFSIDSPYAETHDYIRGKSNTYNRAVKNLLKFKELREKNNTEKPETVLNTVVTEKNYKHLPGMVEFAKKTGCTDLTLIPLINPEKYPELKVKNMKSLKEELKSAGKLAERVNLHTNIDDFKDHYFSNENEEGEASCRDETNKFHEIGCFEPFLNMVIKMDGEVTPCCMIEGQGANIKENSLKKIWMGEYFNKLRGNFKNQGVPEVCSKCILSKENRNQELRNRLKKSI